MDTSSEVAPLGRPTDDGWTRVTTDGWFTAQCNVCSHWFMLPCGGFVDIVERQGFLGLAHHIKAQHFIAEPKITREPLTDLQDLLGREQG